MYGINHERSLPDSLRTHAIEYLNEHKQSTSGPSQAEIKEACARIHTAFRLEIGSIDREGPLATDGDLLVYVVPESQWSELCESVKVFAKARKWAQKVQIHTARQIARKDPYLSSERVREYYDTSDYQAVIVEHP